MIVTLQTRRLGSIGQVRAFVESNESVDYEHRDRESAYAFVGEQLRRLGKRDKGTVRRFLAKTTGLSEVQVDRLIRQWRETGRIEDRRGVFGNRGFSDQRGQSMLGPHVTDRHMRLYMNHRQIEAPADDGGPGTRRIAAREPK